MGSGEGGEIDGNVMNMNDTSNGIATACAFLSSSDCALVSPHQQARGDEIIMRKERKESSYSKKLRDPRWQKKRLVIMERDEWKCQQCAASTTTLNVHHCYYVRGREPWDYEDESLVTLCEECHYNESVNFDNKNIDGFTLSLARYGISMSDIEWLAYILDMESQHKPYRRDLLAIFSSLFTNEDFYKHCLEEYRRRLAIKEGKNG